MNGLLGDDIDPRTQGLLALGLGLMQGRGNFGQAFGAAGQQGLAAYQGAQDRDKQRRMMEQQQRTLAHQQSVAEWQHEQAKKQAAEQAENQAWIRSRPGPGMQNSMQALAGGGGPTQANAARIAPVSQEQDMMFGMLQRGLMTPQAYMEATRKQKPELMKVEQFTDDSGRLRNVAVFKDGTTNVLPYGVKPEIALQSLGNRTVAINKNQLTGNESWQMGMDPAAAAQDARARERLTFDKSQAAKSDQDVEWKQDETGAWFSFPKRLAPGAVARPMPALAPGGGMTPLRGKGAELNEGQAKANTFSARMADAEKVFAEAAASGVDRPGAIKRTAESVGRMTGLGFDTLSNNLADTAGLDRGCLAQGVRRGYLGSRVRRRRPSILPTGRRRRADHCRQGPSPADRARDDAAGGAGIFQACQPIRLRSCGLEGDAVQ
jgi:hypothetical protein